MTEKIQLKNKIISLMDADSINKLIGAYEMMINTIDNLSRLHIDKVNDFINDIASIKADLDDDQKKDFDKDILFVDLLKRNLLHLYSNRLTRKYTSPGIKND